MRPCNSHREKITGKGLNGRRTTMLQTKAAIIDAIHAGALANATTERDPVFGFDVPTECPGVPRDILRPRGVWPDAAAYDATAKKLADLFRRNFTKYESGVSAEIRSAGPA
jgi:phosphoenolpyruvate carboxykinase (ATP)